MPDTNPNPPDGLSAPDDEPVRPPITITGFGSSGGAVPAGAVRSGGGGGGRNVVGANQVEPSQPFDIAAEQARYQTQLDSIDSQLKVKVEQRANINATIKALRDEREAVERMFNATKPRTRKPRATTSKAD